VAGRTPSNPLALAVLACLYERPMYPYEITTTLRERGKEDSIRLNFGSLYSIIKSLEKSGLIVAARAEREGNRPERQVYEITPTGREEAERWLRRILAVPTKEYPDIEAGLSLIGLLAPREAADLLRQRVEALEAEVRRRRAQLTEVTEAGLPEVFSVEADYRVAMMEAELAWVRALVERLERGEVGGQPMWEEMHRRRVAGASPEEIEAAMQEALPAAFRRSGGGGGPATH